jgi:hypothetical protein
MSEGTRPPLAFRGSRRRLRRIRLGEHWSADMSSLTMLIVIALFLVIPWLVRGSVGGLDGGPDPIWWTG